MAAQPHGDVPNTVSSPPSVASRPEVVAGLVNDGTARPVAEVALREAARIRGRVTFVRVDTAGGPHQADIEDDATFRAGLQALRFGPKVPVRFERSRGHVADVLLSRSRGAALLVLGEDDASALEAVADTCRAGAECQVVTVPRPPD